jgi:hypothetical protein
LPSVRVLLVRFATCKITVASSPDDHNADRLNVV